MENCEMQAWGREWKKKIVEERRSLEKSYWSELISSSKLNWGWIKENWDRPNPTCTAFENCQFIFDVNRSCPKLPKKC